MKKRTILRAAVLAALSISVFLLAWLCFDTPSNVYEIEATAGIIGRPNQINPMPISSLTPEQPSFTPEPLETSPQPAANLLGMLDIRSQVIPIANNVDESTLEKGPGWMPDSALPGESGMCVILGHRNRKHLRVREKVEVGNEAVFTYPAGRKVSYTVVEITVYENTADWRLPSMEGNSLVLVTCYPFHYSGHAPGKYQVILRR